MSNGEKEIVNKIKKEPIYSDKITSILTNFETKHEKDIINYLEESWLKYFNTIAESSEHGATFDSEVLLDEFLYHYNDSKKPSKNY